MDINAIQIAVKKRVGRQVRADQKKGQIRHVNSVIPNGGIAKSVMPQIVDVSRSVPDAE